MHTITYKVQSFDYRLRWLSVLLLLLLLLLHSQYTSVYTSGSPELSLGQAALYRPIIVGLCCAEKK